MRKSRILSERFRFLFGEDGHPTVYWIVIKFILKLGIVVSPFVLVPFIASHKIDVPWIGASLATGGARAEKIVSAIMAAISIAGIAAYETVTHLRPRVQAKQFSVCFVENMLDEFAESIKPFNVAVGQDLRVNITLSRRCFLFPFLSRFFWFANRGFGGGHRDNGQWLFTFQGLCGRAFRHRQVLAVDLRKAESESWWPSAGNFWLSCGQRKKTRHLKAIVSIPLFKEIRTDAMTHHKVVGVINVDAVSERGAEWLLTNRERLENFFGDRGTTLVWLSGR